MYAALLNKELVLAVSEELKVRKDPKYLNREIYHCPHCHRRVVLVLSEKSVAFFKHFRSYQNQAGEKIEHHTAKILLKTALVAAGFPAQEEVPLADGGIRADILVNDILAFEIQCAPLGEQEFKHRHNLYSSVNIMDVWIVGKRHFLLKKLKKAQIIFFRKNIAWGNYYLEVDAEKEKLRLKHHVMVEPVKDCVHYCMKTFEIDQKGMNQLWNYKPQKMIKYQVDAEEQRNYLRKQLQEKSNLGLKTGQLLYEHHMSIDDLSDEYFKQLREPGMPVMLENYLKIQSKKKKDS